MQRHARLTAVLLAALALASVMIARHLLADPAVVLLRPKGGADWIRPDRQFDLTGHRDPLTYSAFSASFNVPPSGTSGAVLDVTALKRVAVSVDGRRVFDNGSDVPDWHRPWAVALPALAAGPHRIRLDVANRNGPALVRAACPTLGLFTGTSDWRATDDPKRPSTDWPAAVPAGRPWEPPIAAQFGPAVAAVGRLWPGLALLFAAGAGGYVVAVRSAPGQTVDWGRRVRWGVLIAWAVLAANNISRLPYYVGYDVLDHVSYVKAVADTWRPPLPNAGWETFHPPLYYFCSAVLYRAALACGATVEGATTALRSIPLACGVAMVEWCYRTARRVFPDRSDLHAVAAVVGGLVPMNLYMGQAVSNEPLAACLAAGLTVLCLGLICPGRVGDAATPARWAGRLSVIGVVLGLAILTKLSGLVWAGPVAVAAAVAARRRRPDGPPARRRWAWVAAPAVVLGVAGVVCGWYFVRNQLAIGVPFLSHSTVGHVRWWQDPGYRTPSDFLRFGRALSRPAYGDLTGVWDDLYATLWSDGMLNGVLTFDHRPPWH